MFELDVGDIVSRLLEMRTYDPQLSMRMEHEADLLPEDAVPFLVEKIESAYGKCLQALGAEKMDASQELAKWLTKSFEFYLIRLATGGHVWTFRWPSTEENIQH